MTKCVRKITPSQQKALDWLNDRLGTGVFTKDGSAVIAGGTEGPFTRATWIALRDAQRITIDGNRLTSLTADGSYRPVPRNASDHAAPIRGGQQVTSSPGAE